MKEGGIKLDQGKLRYDLITPFGLEALAQVYTYGAAKYGDRNYEDGLKWTRIFGAIMRHAWAFMRGEDLDPESGLPHMAHAAWGCLTIIHYSRAFKEGDDRPIYKSNDRPTSHINSVDGDGSSHSEKSKEGLT